MKVKIFYEEVTTYVKSHYKVAPLLTHVDGKTIEVSCKLTKLLPAINVQLKIEEIRNEVIYMVYNSSAPISLIITGLVELFGDKMPNGIEVNAKNNQITLCLGQIEKTKKVMEHIKFENVYVNEDSLELTVGLTIYNSSRPQLIRKRSI